MPNVTEPGPLRADRPADRIARAGWILCAAVAVLTGFVLSGRLGAGEAALGLLVIALATVVAPIARPAGVARSRIGPEDGVVGPSTIALLSGLPDPTILLDRKGVVLVFNGLARTALPILRAGDPISFALRTPEVLDAVKAAAGDLAPRVVAYAERVPIERWIEAHVAPAGFGGAGPGVLVVVLRDHTEQRRSERMRADFVANASHELRTPLASLLGFIETLQGPARNDAGARERFLEIMRGQANRMSRLIDDLLSLSRIELKAHLRPNALVDLVGVARGVADALAPLARDRGVVVEVEADTGEVWVLGDRDELIRVVENLTENAIKYGYAGRRVELRVVGGEGREGARLAVRDFGQGIAPEHLPRLTERFYRVDVADSRDKGGTGLGLALVKHILQRHGGRLLVDSTLGEGATFTVALDRAERPVEALLKQAS